MMLILFLFISSFKKDGPFRINNNLNFLNFEFLDIFHYFDNFFLYIFMNWSLYIIYVHYMLH